MNSDKKEITSALTHLGGAIFVIGRKVPTMR
jgi:hypothetical protein